MRFDKRKGIKEKKQEERQVSHIKSASFIEKQAINRKKNGSYVNFTQKHLVD